MTPYASVVIPTHDRASTLGAAVASVQRQTVRDLEIIIAGDGVTPAVRAIAHGLASSDSRVRFIDAPKAPRRGGPNRDHAVRSASAERIFYTDDDDLWLPSHVATLGPLLDDAEIADTLVASVGLSGRLHVSLVDNSDPARRRQFAAGRGKTVFDTHVAHRKSAYLRLDWSWEAGNVGRLFAAFARDTSARWRSRGVVTALSLHGAARADMGDRERTTEIQDWSSRLDGLDGGAALRKASPAWWAFRSVGGFGGAPAPAGRYADTTEEQRADHDFALALARREPCPPTAARVIPALLDRVLKEPAYAELADCLISALGADASLGVAQGLRDEPALSSPATFLEARILAASGRADEAMEKLADERPGAPMLEASWLQLHAELELRRDPMAAASLAARAARLQPDGRQGWRLAFDYALQAGDADGAAHALERFSDLIERDDRLAALPDKRAGLLTRRDKMQAKLMKARARAVTPRA